MWRVIFCAALGLAGTTFAVAPEQILGAEEPKQTLPLEVQPKNGAVEPAPELSLKTAKKERALAVAFKGGVSARNYNLSSSGLNVFLPSAIGYQIGLKVEKELDDTSSLDLDFDYFSHRFANIASFSPASFTVTSWNTSVDYSFLLSGKNARTWWLSLGYQMNKRGGANASPVTPLTDLWFHGPRVGFKYFGPTLFGDLGLNFSSHVMVPWFFQEDIQTTGFYKFGLSSSTTLDLRYELRETTTLTLGLRLNIDYRNYFGTGTRGAISAQELEWVLSFPVSLQIRF